MEALRVRLTHTARTARTSGSARGMRLFAGLALLGALGLGASGCEEASSSGQTEGIVDAWRQSGLTPAVFAKLEDENLKPGTCQQGKVDGVSVVLCEYADNAAAHAAQTTGLGRVGETTGLALAAGKLLLIVSDPDKADPGGRKINAIAEAFRETAAPRQSAAKPDSAEGAAVPPADKKQ